MKSCNMASKRLISNQEAVKKEIAKTSAFDDKQFLHAQNSNSADFQQSFWMESVPNLNDSAINIADKSPSPHGDTPLLSEASVENASVDSNVNKQQLCLSEKINICTPPCSEIPTKPKKSHVTFSELVNSMAKECHSGDSEHINSIAKNQRLISGQPGYDVFIPQAEHWEQSTGDTHGPHSSSMEQNRSKQSSLGHDLSSPGVYLNEEDKTEVSKDEALANERCEVFQGERNISKEFSRDKNEGDATESLVLHNQAATTNSLSTDRTDTEQVSYSEYQRRLESLLSQYNQEGQIIVHRPYPGVVDEAGIRTSYVPGVCQRSVQETAWEQSYDDSVFPSNHRLSTSEDMRTAMMQARKQTYYRRRVDPAPAVCAESGFPLDASMRPNYSRFIRPTKSNLQLKYRNIMAALYRRSFNDWKSQLSTMAGEAQESDEATKTVTNAFLDKWGYLNCPRCHQQPSGIYGKPCLCQKLLPSLCNSNNEKGKRINSRKDTRRKIQLLKKNSAECTEISANLPKSAECGHSPHADFTGGNETGRNCLSTGLLGDTVAESPKQGSKSNTAIKVAQMARAAGERQESGDQGDDGGIARTSDTGQSSSSYRRRRVLMKDVEILNSPDSKSRPLREWEIIKLEGTLKKCLS